MKIHDDFVTVHIHPYAENMGVGWDLFALVWHEIFMNFSFEDKALFTRQ